MTKRRAAGIGTAMGLTALLILGLAGCSLPWKTASPWSHGAPTTAQDQPRTPSNDSTTAPTPRATTPKTLTVPPPGPGEVVRVVYTAGSSLDSPTGTAPEALPQGYVVISGCLPKKPGVSFTYTLTTAEAPYTTLASATMGCSGSSQMDTTMVPDTDAAAVRLWLSGDIGDMEVAYAILTPARYDQPTG